MKEDIEKLKKERDELNISRKKQPLHSQSIIESKKKQCHNCGCWFIEDVKIDSKMCPSCDEKAEASAT